MEESDGQDSSVVRRPIVIVSIKDTIGAATIRRPLKRQGLERKSGAARNRTQDLWLEPPVLCRRGVVAQWQSTGGSSQRPWVRFLAAPLFLSSPCRFKGLRTVAAPIVSLIDTITIGLRTTEESCPSDSSIAVITLSNFAHHVHM